MAKHSWSRSTSILGVRQRALTVARQLRLTVDDGDDEPPGGTVARLTAAWLVACGWTVFKLASFYIPLTIVTLLVSVNIDDDTRSTFIVSGVCLLVAFLAIVNLAKLVVNRSLRRLTTVAELTGGRPPLLLTTAAAYWPTAVQLWVTATVVVFMAITCFGGLPLTARDGMFAIVDRQGADVFTMVVSGAKLFTIAAAVYVVVNTVVQKLRSAIVVSLVRSSGELP